jgi:hypothetical protein
MNNTLAHEQTLVCPVVTSTTDSSSPLYEILPRRCHCRFCRVCRRHLALTFRTRLLEVLRTYLDIQMITLTIDPDLFFGSKEAYLYVSENGYVRNLIKRVLPYSHIASNRYVWVLEFTEGGAPHIHILLDGSYVPEEVVQEEWDRFRPEDAGDPINGRPGFGRTSVTRIPPGDTLEAAAELAAIYLSATDTFIPEWVLKMGADRRIRTFGTSRGFWPQQAKLPRKRPYRPRPRQPNARTYADREADCGTTSFLFRRSETINTESGEISVRRKFIAEIDADVQSLSLEPRADGKGTSGVVIHAHTPEQAIDRLEKIAGSDARIVRLARTGRAA